MALHEHLFELEKSLLTSAVRSDAAKVSALLHPQFFEFGSSGKSWTRDDILERLPKEQATSFNAFNFTAHELSKDTVLITYRTSKVDDAGATTEALRTSLWKLNGEQWQLFFHQGTKVTHDRAPAPLFGFKKWLTEKAIYGQFVHWLVISGATATIAYASYQLNRDKALIDTAKANPIFSIKSKLIQNPESNYFEDEILEISNIGEPLSEFNLDRNTIMTISKGYTDPVAVLPIQYYLVQFPTQASKDLLTTLKMPKNNKAASQLFRAVNQENLKLPYSEYLAYEMKTYLTLSYKNLIGQSQKKCFVSEGLHTNYETVLSECEKARTIEKTYRKGLPEISNLQLTDLLEALAEAKKTQPSN